MMSEILQDHGLGKGLNGADKKALIDIVNAADTNASDVKAAVATAIKAKDDRLKLTPESSWGEIQLALSDLGIDYNQVKTGTGTTTAGVASPAPNFSVTGLGFKPLFILVRSNYSGVLYQRVYHAQNVGAGTQAALDNINRSEVRSDTTTLTRIASDTWTITDDGFSVRMDTNYTNVQNVWWLAVGVGNLPDIPDIYNKVASGKTLTGTTGAVTVTGIAFRPSVVVVRAVLSGATYQRVYSAEAVPTGGQLDFIHKQWIRSDISGTQQGNPFSFTDDGFWVDITTTAGVEVAWWAYGKGETPNLFNKKKSGTITNQTLSGGQGILVSGLGFIPKEIVIENNNNVITVGRMANNGVWEATQDGTSTVGRDATNFSTEPITDSFYFRTSTSLTLTGARWTAYGEGELPDPPPDTYNRVASGQVMSGASNKTFTNHAGSTSLTMASCVVSGLSFKPDLIVLTARSYGGISVTTYKPDLWDYTGAVYADIQAAGNAVRLVSPASVTDGSFELPVDQANTLYDWVAYGVGANPDPIKYGLVQSGQITGSDLTTLTLSGLSFRPSKVILSFEGEYGSYRAQGTITLSNDPFFYRNGHDDVPVRDLYSSVAFWEGQSGYKSQFKATNFITNDGFNLTSAAIYDSSLKFDTVNWIAYE